MRTQLLTHNKTAYSNVPEVRDLLAKYGRRPPQPKIDVGAILGQTESFADWHGRLPSTSHSDEMKLAKHWQYVKRRYGNLDRVVELVERFPIQNRR